MKPRVLFTLALACAVVFLGTQPAGAILYGTTQDGEEGVPWNEGVSDWKAEGVEMEVENNHLMLKGDGRVIAMFDGGDSPANMKDYETEVYVRKLTGNYLAIHARVNKPAVDFYLIEISFGSNTISTHTAQGGGFNEITPGGNAGRPKRPESKDQDKDGNVAYKLKFAIEGETLKYWVDDKLMIATADATWKKGPPGLGAQGSTNEYYWVRVDTIPEGELGIVSTQKQLSVDNKDKLAVKWGQLKRGVK